MAWPISSHFHNPIKALKEIKRKTYALTKHIYIFTQAQKLHRILIVSLSKLTLQNKKS